VDPRASLDDWEKIKFLTLPGLELPSLVQPVASRYTDCAIPAHVCKVLPEYTASHSKVRTPNNVPFACKFETFLILLLN
jgi:hypothetical protein